MTTSLVDAESLLALEIGSVTTRAVLFDVVEGRYRYLGAGSVPTTAGAPFHNIMDGVRGALQELEQITGRTFIGADGQLTTPAQPDGTGVDACVASLSVGPPLKVLAVGLLEDVSTESAQNLATTTYAQVIETMSLNDRKKTTARLDNILRLRPDLVVVAGGIEKGASKSVLSILESVGLACGVLPKEQRPEVLFAGNSALVKEVQQTLGTLASLQVAPNVRPTLDIEQLTPAQPALAQVFRHVRARQIRGVQDVDLWTGGKLLPSAMAFGRTIRYISIEFPKKGVLGVDAGASATTIASAFAGDLILSVQSKLGLGENLPGILSLCNPEDILRWLPIDIPAERLRDYIYNKSLYPASIPATEEQLLIEHALATQAIYLAVRQARKGYPASVRAPLPGLLPPFEPIIATGSVLTQVPRRSQALMILLNALQPTGVTTIALDRNNLASMLGAAAGKNHYLTVQSLDATNFYNLGTIISPIGQANPGTPVLHVRISLPGGHETTREVKFGTLEILELPMGQTATLRLQPLHRFDVGMGGPGVGGSAVVTGGECGVIIDARGRPIRLHNEPGRRQEQIKRWNTALGA
ncbi:MAG: glutamate mutase L [Anaerolineales bacterium]|nr:glutamate mutase L [Anaerolineales bacterium]